MYEDKRCTRIIDKINIEEKTGSYQYTINYSLENKNNSGSINEGSFKMFYKNSEGGLPQYGGFWKLFAGDIKDRIYTLGVFKILCQSDII